jgi:hypothetical protein
MRRVAQDRNPQAVPAGIVAPLDLAARCSARLMNTACFTPLRPRKRKKCPPGTAVARFVEEFKRTARKISEGPAVARSRPEYSKIVYEPEFTGGQAAYH